MNYISCELLYMHYINSSSSLGDCQQVYSVASALQYKQTRRLLVGSLYYKSITLYYIALHVYCITLQVDKEIVSRFASPGIRHWRQQATSIHATLIHHYRFHIHQGIRKHETYFTVVNICPSSCALVKHSYDTKIDQKGLKQRNFL